MWARRLSADPLQRPQARDALPVILKTQLSTPPPPPPARGIRRVSRYCDKRARCDARAISLSPPGMIDTYTVLQEHWLDRENTEPGIVLDQGSGNDGAALIITDDPPRSHSWICRIRGVLLHRSSHPSRRMQRSRQAAVDRAGIRLAKRPASHCISW